MEFSQVILDISLTVIAIIFFFAWSRENKKRRDYGTELASLIHKYDLDSRNLRRSLHHKEIRKEVEKNYDLPGDFIEEMKNS